MEIQIEDQPPYRIVCLAGDVDMHSSPKAREAILDALKQKKAPTFRQRLALSNKRV